MYFTDNHDQINVQDRSVVLTQYTGEVLRSYVLGTYRSEDRAVEVLRETIDNMDAKGLVFPEE